MTKRKITLTNTFHHTTCTVIVPAGIANQRDAWEHLQELAHRGGPADRRRLTRVRQALCPWNDCRCGVLRPA